jgi:hypothetical protein
MSLLHTASTQADDKLYPEDVFSTYLYTGNGSTQTINNGIDLAGEGGLVWLKGRSSTSNNYIQDTTTFGTGSTLITNTTNAFVGLGSVTANTNGFSLVNGNSNYSNETYASWTFRKAPKFFDVVTYTGDGTNNRQIPHSLGCEVGMIIVKTLNAVNDWGVYHRKTGALGGSYLLLNTTAGESNNGACQGLYLSTETYFVVDGLSPSYPNYNGQTYVAYLYAHDTSAD